MINVYLVGHGFLWKNAKKVDVKLPIVTYVMENKLLCGESVGNLIQTGKYVHTSADNAAETRIYSPGEQIAQHLLCGDDGTLNDVASCEKYTNLTNSDYKDNYFSFGIYGGMMKFDENTWVYMTEILKLTRLSDIQRQLEIHIATLKDKKQVRNNVILHWAACRSYVCATTFDELLKGTQSGLLAPQGLAGEKLPMGEGEIFTVGGLLVSSNGLEANIKSIFNDTIDDCFIFFRDNLVITVILPKGKADAQELTNMYYFNRKLGSQEKGPIENFKQAKKKIIVLNPTYLPKGGHLSRKVLKENLSNLGKYPIIRILNEIARK